MPRTLPWLTSVKKEISSPAPETKRKVKDEPLTPKKESSPSKRNFLRSSPSPPSSPIHRCPSEEFLREGLDNDDIHVMVEDEFYTVAQSFTRHLHYAEYVRGRKEAKTRNAATIADLARPTDGITPMSEALRKKYAAEELKKKQEDGVATVLGERGEVEVGDHTPEDDIDAQNLWAGTHLQDLMPNPRRGRLLVGVQGVRSTTRAAKGFAQAVGAGARTENEPLSGSRVVDSVGGDGAAHGNTSSATWDESTDDEDDDDLEAGTHRSSPTVSRRTPTSLGSGPRSSPPRIACTQTGNRWSTPTVSGKTYASIGSGASKSTPRIAYPADNHKRARPSEPENKTSTFKDDQGVKSEGSASGKDLLRPSKTPESTKASRRLLFDDGFEEYSITRVIKTENEPDRMQARRRRAFDDFDELPDIKPPQPQRPRSDITNKKPRKVKEENTGLKKKLNEVPTFLL
ncbi:hypothetical protein BJX99DRAFT_101560 [Aspergillus californicus]